MNSLAIWVCVVCIISMSICGLASCLVLIEIISQVNASKVAPGISEWGRKSIWEMWRIHRLHRQLFPASALRKVNVALMCFGVATLFVLISVVITHPGPPSRTSQSQLIKSPQ
jgi:hypothetical protein